MLLAKSIKLYCLRAEIIINRQESLDVQITFFNYSRITILRLILSFLFSATA